MRLIHEMWTHNPPLNIIQSWHWEIRRTPYNKISNFTEDMVKKSTIILVTFSLTTFLKYFYNVIEVGIRGGGVKNIEIFLVKFLYVKFTLRGGWILCVAKVVKVSSPVLYLYNLDWGRNSD